jgi:hypothetical protein
MGSWVLCLRIYTPLCNLIAAITVFAFHNQGQCFIHRFTRCDLHYAWQPLVMTHSQISELTI